MKPKDRLIAALTLNQPEDIVPTFEFEFGLSKDLTGRDFRDPEQGSTGEREYAVRHNAELHLEIAEKLDWSAITEHHLEVIRELVKMGAGDQYMLCTKDGDATFRFYAETNTDELLSHLFDKPDEFKRKLEKDTEDVIEGAKKLIDAGVSCFVMGADYAGTRGPFLSPEMFAEFVVPFLHRTISAHQENGAFVIKHTDGNIMPIIEQILSCGPDALHSVDPTAGMDIAELKELYGDRVCLAGNVDCGALIRHDLNEIRRTALYCLQQAKPGGGYVYSSSNCINPPMKLGSYLYMLELRKKHGRYDE